MNRLLCSLGSSWAVVPEAYNFPVSSGFQEVHCITSLGASTDKSVENVIDYFADIPVVLSITRIQGFNNLHTLQEHKLFEEALYRWLGSFPLDGRYICLAGGYKTMSAAFQQAARMFGCKNYFHVLAQPVPSTGRDPTTREEVETAIALSAISYIPFGEQTGERIYSSVPVINEEVVSTNGIVRVVKCSDTTYNDNIEYAKTEVLNISLEELSTLPLPQIARLPNEAIAWLNNPLELGDKAWVQQLPKLDLHCHLGGFGTHGAELDAVCIAGRRKPIRVPIPSNWPLPANPIGLAAYRALGDATGSALLSEQECLRAQCALMYKHFESQNLRYVEVRCSPANYVGPMTAWDVLGLIRSTFNELMLHGSCHINLIIIATRRDGGDLSAIAHHLALAVVAAEHWKAGCEVVGVDLAGQESALTRAGQFLTDFKSIHRVGLAITAHAGENDDVEGVWQAVYQLFARRIGHGLVVSDSPSLLKVMVDRSIGIELCPYANVQINGYKLDRPLGYESYPIYPLLELLQKGVKVSVNTDNIGISAANITDNFLLLVRLCHGITRMDIIRLLVNAEQTAFTTLKPFSSLSPSFLCPP